MRELIRMAMILDDMNQPFLADKMEKFALRPFNPETDIIDPEEYKKFTGKYTPVQSIGQTKEGFPLVVLPKGGINKLLRQKADEGWEFQGYALRGRPKAKGQEKGFRSLSLALGLPGDKPWAVFDRSGGPLIEHELVHLSQFDDPNWNETFDPQYSQLDEIGQQALKNDVDLDDFLDKLSPYEIVARVAEVARVLSSGSRPPAKIKDFSEWVHNKTTQTSPKLLTEIILETLKEVPHYKLRDLVDYHKKDFQLWKTVVEKIQQELMRKYRIPGGYRNDIKRTISSPKSQSGRSKPPSRPSSRHDTTSTR